MISSFFGLLSPFTKRSHIPTFFVSQLKRTSSRLGRTPIDDLIVGDFRQPHRERLIDNLAGLRWGAVAYKKRTKMLGRIYHRKSKT